MKASKFAWARAVYWALHHRISGTAGRILVSWMSDESGYIYREANLLILLAISERHKTIPNELDGMNI
jgi:hypothetical protein